MRILNSEGYTQYKRESLIEATVSGARPFSKALVKRSNENNGAKNVTYEFTVQVSLPVYKSEFIKIIPPAAIDF